MFKKINGITENISFMRKSAIDKEIDLEILYLTRTLGNMEDYASEEYKTLLERLNTLNEIKNGRIKNASFTTADVLKLTGAGLTAGAGILSLMMVLKYENSDEIITSKAFGMVGKLIGK